MDYEVQNLFLNDKILSRNIVKAKKFQAPKIINQTSSRPLLVI
jgi:hypothetical protein